MTVVDGLYELLLIREIGCYYFGPKFGVHLTQNSTMTALAGGAA